MDQYSKFFISVIIPVFNEEDHLRSCLDSILDQNMNKKNYEIIVVDNGSTDNSFSIAKDYQIGLYSLENANVGAVRNFGASVAKGDILVFLDSDCVVCDSWLSQLSKDLTSSENVVLGGGCSLPCNPCWLEKYWFLESPQSPNIPKDLIGAAIALKREHFDAVGGFDETITSGEDTKLSKSLEKAGLNILIDQKYNVIHLGNAKNIKDFIKRKSWHSENYLADMRVTAKDPTFYLVSIFSLLIIALPIASLFSPIIIKYILLAALTIPLIFSMKRIYRKKYYKSNITSYFIIYFIDIIYLVGRSIGLTKSIFKTPVLSKTNKFIN